MINKNDGRMMFKSKGLMHKKHHTIFSAALVACTFRAHAEDLCSAARSSAIRRSFRLCSVQNSNKQVAGGLGQAEVEGASVAEDGPQHWPGGHLKLRMSPPAGVAPAEVRSRTDLYTELRTGVVVSTSNRTRSHFYQCLFIFLFVVSLNVAPVCLSGAKANTLKS